MQVDNDSIVGERFPFEGPSDSSSQKTTAGPSGEDAQPTEDPKRPEPDRKGIAVREGLLVPAHSGELMAVAKELLNSRALPQQFQNVSQVAMGMQLLRQLGIPEIVGLRQLAIINGSFSIWGELPKALVERSGELEEFEEFLFLDDYTQISFENKNLKAPLWGAYCFVKRRGRKPITRTFTVEDAKLAGLWANPKRDPWVKYPKRMMQMKARSWALKDAFPDVLYGVSIAEYDHDVLPGAQAKLVSAPSGAADEINKEFLETTNG